METSYCDTLIRSDFRRGVYCCDCGGSIAPYNETLEHAVKKWNARAERACSMRPANGGGWYCSRCHIWVAPGPMANATEHMAPRYCPSCGAKVVG